MSGVPSQAYALNQTRQAYLATRLAIAGTHISRLRGLLGTPESGFRSGQGLWIVPSHGVHTFGMRFPIDIVYLDQNQIVVFVQQSVKPWRIAPVRKTAASVLELPRDTVRETGTAVGDKIEITVVTSPSEVNA